MLTDDTVNELWTDIISNKDKILENKEWCDNLLCNKNKMILDIIQNNNMEFNAETYVMVAFLLNMMLIFNMMVCVVNKN